MPTIYVIAGPNGIGKTTSSYDIIPHNIAIINSDEIAKEVRNLGLVSVNTQEYSNREATRLVNEQIEKRNDFAIETNLCDVDTWKFLLGLQANGYTLHIMFVSTDNVEILNKRIEERVLLGEHFVREDIVLQRYLAGLNLLKHYFEKPDVLQLFDNSEKMELIADIRLGNIFFLSATQPGWVKQNIIIKNNENKAEEENARNAADIDSVRNLYKNIKNKSKE